ncbi:MAG: aminopeptidase [Oscillospiraceae bacterium]|nr:aminopeptidase [Oscillospiraceae bacterium]
MKKTRLSEYAKLIVSVGANIKSGRDVVIRAGLDQPEFVILVAEECYKKGARKVSVEWAHPRQTRARVKYESLETMSVFEDWEVSKLKHRAKTLPTRIYLISDDPDALRGVDRQKLAAAEKAKYPILKPICDEEENKYQWCIAAVPGVKWAKKLFPEDTASRAVEKLWEAVLCASRVGKDPLADWAEHNKDLQARCDRLNSLGLKTLEYSSGNGTKLKVGLIEKALFLGGGEYTTEGVYFNPNIPTEEVYTSPKRGEAEGTVYSARPLSYNGELIEDFSIRFADGKAVELRAGKNEELLKTMASMDEGAPFLGECAFVPCDSPVYKSGILFYNTLFDENAACHLALGRGYTNCIREYGKYSIEECRAFGINDSMIHEDFMIGTPDTDIDGITREGLSVAIFRNGNWAW